MASICFSPPDSVPASCLRRSLSRGKRVKATSASRSSGAPQAAATVRLSATLRFGNTDRPSRTWQMPMRASAVGARVVEVAALDVAAAAGRA